MSIHCKGRSILQFQQDVTAEFMQRVLSCLREFVGPVLSCKCSCLPSSKGELTKGGIELSSQSRSSTKEEVQKCTRFIVVEVMHTNPVITQINSVRKRCMMCGEQTIRTADLIEGAVEEGSQ